MATMFRKLERGKMICMVQIAVPGVGRKTVRLGDAPDRAAVRVREHLEDLAACKRLNVPAAPDTAKWLSGVADDLHDDLVSIGLAQPRGGSVAGTTLKAFLDRYIEQKRPDLAPRSVQLLEQTRDRLLAALGAGTPLDRITAGSAADWRAAMVGEGLSEASIRLHTRNAKSIFNSAVDREILARNPFRALPSGAVAANRDFYLGVGDAERVLAELPDDQWRLLFALARFGGLRTSSETHTLAWNDVDLKNRRMSVFAPKTGATRIVPIIPPLAEVLKAAWSCRAPDAQRVILLSTNNLHRTVRAAAERAGVPEWPDVFQTLRRAAASDFAMNFPSHAVAAWMGHGVAVSARHYLQVPAELYERAAATNGDSALRKALQQRPELSRTGPQTHKTLKIAPSGDAA